MFFRYPGGKNKIRKQIVDTIWGILKEHPCTEYREPFFGGGAIGINVLKENAKNDNLLQSIWINDFDLGIACLWTSVLQHREVLLSVVDTFKPSVNLFDKYKKELLNVTTGESPK